MSDGQHLLAYRLGDQLHGVSLGVVRTVRQAVEVTIVPGSPPTVRGVIDVHGRVVPVIDMHRKVGFATRPLELTDRFILIETTRGPLALAVDAIYDVIEVQPGEITRSRDVVPDADHVEGIVRLKDGLLIVHDVERFFRPEQAELKLDTSGSAGPA